jgi:hypothetical protein
MRRQSYRNPIKTGVVEQAKQSRQAKMTIAANMIVIKNLAKSWSASGAPSCTQSFPTKDFANPAPAPLKPISDQFDADFVEWAKSPAVLVNGGLGAEAVQLAQTA